MNIFKTLFGGRDNSTDNKQKEEKNFEILKYDGVRALKTSQVDYAIQCFTHALEMNDADLECRDYLSRAYIMTGDLPQAYEQLRIMSEACPDNVAILVRIADVAYMMENYTMMADACEAATRSLKNPDEATITNLVDKIISSQLADGLLNEAPINMREIGIVKQSFINRLRSMFHQRIEYPEEITPKQE